MKNLLFIFLLSLSTTLFAVTGNGTGANTQVAGHGSGTEVAGHGSGTEVTGNGTGASSEVTGNGTGASSEVTGNGTGASSEVTGNGTGASSEVAGHGSGTEVAGHGSGREVAGHGSGREVAGHGSGSEATVGIDACYSGSWYDPNVPAEGINIEVLVNQVLVYFYTYDVEGRQTWFVFQGDSEFQLTAYDIINRETVDVGYGAVEPTGDNTLIFSYDFVLDLDLLSPTQPIPWCLHIGCSREVVYQRLTQPIPCASD